MCAPLGKFTSEIKAERFCISICWLPYGSDTFEVSYLWWFVRGGLPLTPLDCYKSLAYCLCFSTTLIPRIFWSNSAALCRTPSFYTGAGILRSARKSLFATLLTPDDPSILFSCCCLRNSTYSWISFSTRSALLIFDRAALDRISIGDWTEFGCEGLTITLSCFFCNACLGILPSLCLKSGLTECSIY